MEMQTLAIGVGLVVFGFLLGRLTAPKEKTTTVYEAVSVRNKRQPVGGGEIGPADAEIEAAILLGQKIEAIKLYRAAYGTDLKDSKEAVEAIEARLGNASQ